MKVMAAATPSLAALFSSSDISMLLVCKAIFSKIKRRNLFTSSWFKVKLPY
jgi:hypothetical protein